MKLLELSTFKILALTLEMHEESASASHITCSHSREEANFLYQKDPNNATVELLNSTSEIMMFYMLAN